MRWKNQTRRFSPKWHVSLYALGSWELEVSGAAIPVSKDRQRAGKTRYFNRVAAFSTNSCLLPSNHADPVTLEAEKWSPERRRRDFFLCPDKQCSPVTVRSAALMWFYPSNLKITSSALYIMLLEQVDACSSVGDTDSWGSALEPFTQYLRCVWGSELQWEDWEN